MGKVLIFKRLFFDREETVLKYVVFLGDGMADEPLEELKGGTPLEAARHPNMDRIASDGVMGMAVTIPQDMACRQRCGEPVGDRRRSFRLLYRAFPA